jgi:hypothetical protein
MLQGSVGKVGTIAEVEVGICGRGVDSGVSVVPAHAVRVVTITLIRITRLKVAIMPPDVIVYAFN